MSTPGCHGQLTSLNKSNAACSSLALPFAHVSSPLSACQVSAAISSASLLDRPNSSRARSWRTMASFTAVLTSSAAAASNASRHSSFRACLASRHFDIPVASHLSSPPREKSHLAGRSRVCSAIGDRASPLPDRQLLETASQGVYSPLLNGLISASAAACWSGSSSFRAGPRSDSVA